MRENPRRLVGNTPSSSAAERVSAPGDPPRGRLVSMRAGAPVTGIEQGWVVGEGPDGPPPSDRTEIAAAIAEPTP